MKGIELSRRYFEAFGKPMLEARFPDFIDRIAVGLVGHGSECFGFDDDVSLDHDFEAGFCIWITDEDEKELRFRLERAYASLPKEFEGIRLKTKSALGYGNTGVHTISEFYRKYTGSGGAPENAKSWLYTPSFYLAEATNGKVFMDNLGEFTAIRNQILNGMPQDVQYKKIASKAVLMAQTGQYNYLRCIKHGEEGAAALTLSKFCEHAAQMLYLLNGRHAPYYKWLLRGAKELPVLGNQVTLIEALLTENKNPDKKADLIEEICRSIADRIIEMGLSPEQGNYLESYAFSVNEKIRNNEIRNLHIIQE